MKDAAHDEVEIGSNTKDAPSEVAELLDMDIEEEGEFIRSSMAIWPEKIDMAGS